MSIAKHGKMDMDTLDMDTVARSNVIAQRGRRTIWGAAASSAIVLSAGASEDVCPSTAMTVDRGRMNVRGSATGNSSDLSMNIPVNLHLPSSPTASAWMRKNVMNRKAKSHGFGPSKKAYLGPSTISTDVINISFIISVAIKCTGIKFSMKAMTNASKRIGVFRVWGTRRRRGQTSLVNEGKTAMLRLVFSDLRMSSDVGPLLAPN